MSILPSCARTGIGKDIARYCGQTVCITIITLSLYTKEKHYGTRINYVAVGSPARGDRAVVPVPCYLTSQHRIGRVSRAAVRPRRCIRL